MIDKCFYTQNGYAKLESLKLAYLAVYGHTSSEQCGEARQLSTHGQKFDPESLWAY